MLGLLSIKEVLEEYPQLSRQGVLACVAYGAEMSRERSWTYLLNVRLEGKSSMKSRIHDVRPTPQSSKAPTT